MHWVNDGVYLNKPEDAAYPEDPDDAEESGRHRKVGHEILHEDADDGSDYQDEVKQVPGRREVVVSQPDDLHCRL